MHSNSIWEHPDIRNLYKKIARDLYGKTKRDLYGRVRTMYLALKSHNLKVVHSCKQEYYKPFAWNFQVGFLGQMEQFISSGKNGSKYDAVPFVKNNPVELSRLGQQCSLSRRPWVREWHKWDFLQMVQLIPVISVETKKRNTFEGIPSILENFHWVELFHLTFHPQKTFFRCKW